MPKYVLSYNNALNNKFFSKLNEKTQMIRKLNKCDTFTDRHEHTKEVVETCREIIYTKNINNIVNEDLLFCSAVLHDIGHTPFGHAGEEEINELFLTHDKIHYSESKPGMFKHNINSIRLMSELYIFKTLNDYVVMDSILKHSSVFPKEYNYYVFSDTNILKMNYVFRDIGLDNSSFLDLFIKEYIKHGCCKRGTRVVKDRTSCFSCSRNKYCFYKKDNLGKNDCLSLYLNYPYPLTLQGTVLYWADEISCFCSDLKDMFVFLKKYENKLSDVIPLSKIVAELSLLETTYPKNQLLLLVQDYCNLLIDNKMSFEKSYEEVKIKIKNIKNLLVSSIDITCELNNEISLNFSEIDGCLPLFSLKKDDLLVWKSIKKAIYQDVHSISYIKRTNKIGKKCIDALVKHYTNNFSDLVKDARDLLKINFIQKLAFAIHNMLSIKEEQCTQKKFITECFNAMKEKDFRIDHNTLLKNKFLSAYLNEDYSIKVSNLFKREIGYFVATLTEKDIKQLSNKYNIKKILNLPIKYA